MAAVAIRELHLEVCNGEAYNENDYGATSHYQFPVGLLNDPSTKVVGRSLEHRSLDSVRGNMRQKLARNRHRGTQPWNMRQKLARNRHRGTQPWAMTETYAIEADGLVVNSRQDLHYESGDLVWVNNQKLFVSDRPKNLSCYVLGNGMSVRVVYSDVLFRPDLMLDGKIYTRFGPPLKCGNYRVICQEPDQLTGTHLTSLAPEDIARAQCLASNPALRARIFRNKLTLHERGFMSRAINASYAPEPSSSPASPLSSYSTASEPGYYPESEPATPRILSLPFHLMGEPVRRPSDPLRSFEQAIEYRLALSGSPRRQSPYTAKAEVDPWFHSAEGSFAWSSDASAAGSWQGEQDEQKYIDF